MPSTRPNSTIRAYAILTEVGRGGWEYADNEGIGTLCDDAPAITFDEDKARELAAELDGRYIPITLPDPRNFEKNTKPPVSRGVPGTDRVAMDNGKTWSLRGNNDGL